MNFRRYPAYKDSGVTWLGEIPASWETRRVRFLFGIKKEIAGTEGYDVLSITQQGIKVKNTEENEGQMSMDYSKYQRVSAGDFAMNHMDLLTGFVDISAFDGVTSPDYRVFCKRNDTAIDEKYFLHLFQNGYRQKIFYAFGQGASHFGRWRFPTDEFRDFVFPFPPLHEQQQIACYLDAETAKIDALIAKKEQLLAQVEEKRQAVISHAVTKGVRPGVPMKNSGSSWLGDVPAHWEIKRVKHLSSHIVDCLHTTPTYEGELQYPAVRTADIERGRLLLEQVRLVSRDVYEERIQRLRPKAGDILYSREGERFGIAALVPDGVELCLGQRMMMFRIKASSDPTYVMWVLNSEAVFQQVLEGTAGATSPHVNISDIKNFAVPCPPLEEQRRIAQHISRSIELLDALKAKVLAVSERLQEHRAALISAAVTGKIDLRSPHTSNVVSFTARQRRNRLAAEVIHQFHNDNTFGRTKAQKVFYLLDAHLGVTEFNGRYERWIAGPYDAAMMRSVAADLESAGWFREVEEGGRYLYRPLTKASEIRGAFTDAWAERKGEIEEFLRLLRPLDTQQAEVIATLYAAWNDLLLRGDEVSDTKLLTEVTTNWHEAKKAIPERAWKDGLRWLRQHGVVPKGTGSQTIQQMSLGL